MITQFWPILEMCSALLGSGCLRSCFYCWVPVESPFSSIAAVKMGRAALSWALINVPRDSQRLLEWEWWLTNFQEMDTALPSWNYCKPLIPGLGVPMKSLQWLQLFHSHSFVHHSHHSSCCKSLKVTAGRVVHPKINPDHACCLPE